MNNTIIKWTLIVFGFALTISLSASQISSTSTRTRKPDKELRYEDYVYEENFATARIYPLFGSPNDEIQPAVINIQQSIPLFLEFDELYADYQEYNAKILHCNADWSRSNLQEVQYLPEYNEFPIRDFEYSLNTRIPYTHYSLTLPRVNIPGNYVVVVYRDRDEEDIILSQRFMVFDDRIAIRSSVGVSTRVFDRLQNHQIEFDLHHRGVQIFNPYRDVKVVVRQNQRWDNAITDLKPTQVRESDAILQYRHFNLENNFKATNEYRFFDLTSFTFLGRFMEEIEVKDDEINAYVTLDKSRIGQAYGQYQEMNGQFIINTTEPSASFLELEYFNVFFQLQTPPVTQDIYLIGAFNYYQRAEDNLMTFDAEKNLYTGQALLKQGQYDYLYYVEGGEPHPYILEGVQFEAENRYDILVYVRPSGSFDDLLLGYIQMSSRQF